MSRFDLGQLTSWDLRRLIIDTNDKELKQKLLWFYKKAIETDCNVKVYVLEQEELREK